MSDETGRREPLNGAPQDWSQSQEHPRAEPEPEPQAPPGPHTGSWPTSGFPVPPYAQNAETGRPPLASPEHTGQYQRPPQQQPPPPQQPPQRQPGSAGPAAQGPSGTGPVPMPGGTGPVPMPGGPPTGPPGGPPTGGMLVPSGGYAGDPQWQGPPGGGGWPKRERRGMPVWAVLVTVAVVALVAAGLGGVAGGYLGSESSESETGSGGLTNEVPSGAPSRPADSIAGVAQRVGPSVVSIKPEGGGGGNGSGFIIKNNYVVTNNHVAEAMRGEGIEITYSDGHTSGAAVVGTAPSSDLAVLKIEDPIEVDPLKFGDSEDVTVGDTVIAIGSPLGLQGTVTTGIVSAVDRPVSVGQGDSATYMSALQTDAAINPGNSGGPLVNAKGKVVGVNSAIATMGGGPLSGQQSGSIGLGFAIPSSQAQDVVNELIETGSASHAEIGVVLDTRYQDNGALIIEEEGPNGQKPIVPDGPAAKAGLQPGDIITQFAGEDVNNSNQLIVLVRGHQAGEKVQITYERGSKEQTTFITLGEAD